MGSSKNKIQNRVNYINRESYNLFKEKNNESKITYDQFITILKESTKLIRDTIINNTLGFKLPYNLGYIAVDRFKPKKDYKAIDWVNTKRLGKRIPLTNLHSLGYMYTVKFYNNPKVQPIKNYMFKAHRLLNRLIKPMVVKDFNNYIHIDRSYFSKRFNIDNFLNKQ